MPSGRLSSLVADITPLKESRDFRLIFGGQTVSWIGRQLSVVAVPFQVFSLSNKSSLAVGLVGLADLGPLIVVSMLGGAIADAFDRRKVLLVTQLLLAATSAGLAVNSQQVSPQLWIVYLMSALGAGFQGIDLPTRNAVIPSLVRREIFPAAAALNQILMNLGIVAGPALAGLLIGHVSLSATYWIDAGSSLVAFVTLLAIRPLPPIAGGRRVGLSSVREGFGYLRGQRALVGTFVIDLNAMIFGMPRALFPAFGTQILGGGPGAVGLLYAAPGAGGLLGALFTGWVNRVQRQGRAVLVAVLIWGAAIAGFGLVRSLPAALVLLAVAGAADMISAVFRNTILQLSITDAVRGRLSAIHIAVVTGGPRLGDIESGAVASLTSPRFSAVSGGLACMAGALVVGKLIPQLVGYKVARESPETTGLPDAAPAAER